MLGRVRGLAPILKTSVAYPLRERFRTGTILAMFTLVVFTLVVGATTSNAFTSAGNDTVAFGGGFDVRAIASPANPITDMRAAICGVADAPSVRLSRGRGPVVPAGGSEAARRVQFRATTRSAASTMRTSRTPASASPRRRTGYPNARAVWRALQREPGLAVVDPLIVPHRNNWNFAALPTSSSPASTSRMPTSIPSA